MGFGKAFDTINRVALFHKLTQYNITGPFANIIKDMYNSLLCSVKNGNYLKESFSTKTEVKHGCVLSPSRFSLYVNDLNNLFEDSCDQVQIGSLFTSCLLYADDLVLLSTSDKGLQIVLDKLSSFCFKWNLKVKVDRTFGLIRNPLAK